MLKSKRLTLGDALVASGVWRRRERQEGCQTQLDPIILLTKRGESINKLELVQRTTKKGPHSRFYPSEQLSGQDQGVKQLHGLTQVPSQGLATIPSQNANPRQSVMDSSGN